MKNVHLDLFTDQEDEKLAKTMPLAARMRPQKLSDILGQEKILYPASPLRNLIESKGKTQSNSIILWGPPGSGKTTIAKLIANDNNRNFRQLSAVTSGVSDIRQVIEEARQNLISSGKQTVLFIDEVHRFSRSQQDALLPSVENSVIILIAATTENPSFSIIAPLISRSLVVRLESLTDKDIKKIIQKALKSPRGLNNEIFIDKKASENLARLSSGDARKALTILQAAAAYLEKFKREKSKGEKSKREKSKREKSKGQTAKSQITKKEFPKIINCEILDKVIDENVIVYDKAQDEHYDVASAFIKSLRGSDADAALHYLARMIKGGEDPRFIARRLIISAAEEIGMADPNALNIAISAAQAVQLIGLPEARIPLAQAVVYIATAPKSNAVY
ncbi:MAG: replication-associated recombination protein A, partial [Bifidobacteriaceae bacterium]|nr:replication-associated recombination protein A [Bifidobacteriaceae bacterium]